MHLDLPHLTWSGPPVDDAPLLERVPEELAAALRGRNGCLAYRGALHVRGACSAPSWHSLRDALEGPDAFHRLYPAVEPSDLPFAEEALGDQYLLRGQAVFRLVGETGDLEEVYRSLGEWFMAVLEDPVSLLSVDPVVLLAPIGGTLEPGKLLSAYPPFVTAESAKGVTLRAIDALDRRRWLADLARDLRDLPDGAPLELKPVP